MKKVIAYTIADQNNIEYAKMLEKTIRKFHTAEELPFHIVQGEELNNYLKSDQHFFYRATPIIAKKFIDEYETVIKMDADQLVLGNLNYLWETNDFEVGTVLNINRVDPQKYGLVQIQGVIPQEYFNCGLVVMKSKKFIEHWEELCMSKYFYNFQYREQDLLNLLCHFGQYKVRCLDYYDNARGESNFWGLVSKGEWHKAILKDKQVILPRGTDNYPDRDTVLKVIHWAGGGFEKRMNYKAYFQPEVSDYIDTLIK